jgi:hypothetical protein
MWHEYAGHRYTTSLPRIAPARRPLLWEMADAGQGEFNPHTQLAPDLEFDQRFAW